MLDEALAERILTCSKILAAGRPACLANARAVDPRAAGCRQFAARGEAYVQRVCGNCRYFRRP